MSWGKIAEPLVVALLVTGIAAAIAVYGEVQALDTRVDNLENVNAVLSGDVKALLIDVAKVCQAVGCE